MSKTLEEARLPSLKEKIEAAVPKDTVETIVQKVKKAEVNLKGRTATPKLGGATISKKKK